MNECTFSLLLKDWGEWRKAIEVFEWVPFAVLMDTRGSRSLIEKLNISSKVLGAFNSFLECCVLNLFQQKKIIKNTDSIFSLLRFIGKEFFHQINEYHKTLSQVEQNVQFMTIKEVPVIKCLTGVQPTNTLNHVLKKKKKEKWGFGGIVIYSNTRPLGSIAVKRYDNDERVDFMRIANRKGVIFTHPNGFFAVMENNISDNDLEQYIKDAIE